MPEPTSLEPIRLFLVEDHALMRRGLQGQFSLEPDFEVVGEAENGQQAIELATQVQPDIILMDIDLPILDGISATQHIKAICPDIRVLALSAFGRDSQVVGMLAAGADGYCLKRIEWPQLLAVLRLIQGGGTYLDPQIAQKLALMLKSPPSLTAALADQPATTPEKSKPVITDREREVLQLISEGLSNQEIAHQLYLSLGTVKAYVRMILNKLSVDDRVQAAAKAVREGLI
jgi:DNA-binding NarL/FixJ family response regulator